MSRLTTDTHPGMREDLDCPECGASMVLRNSRYGPFYGCIAYPKCKATHGAHEDGSPLGIPADKETKRWRMKCHEVFDQLWKNPEYCYSRREAYELLQRLTGLPEEEAHIGRFDIDTCKRVIQKINRSFKK
jgi:ssDNA-binding Zn-finger/Zn-ribbon topoisomerase 1